VVAVRLQCKEERGAKTMENGISYRTIKMNSTLTEFTKCESKEQKADSLKAAPAP